MRDQAEALRAHGECTSELNKLLAQQQAALAEARHLEAEAHRSIGAAEVREAAAVAQEKVLKEREAELELRQFHDKAEAKRERLYAEVEARKGRLHKMDAVLSHVALQRSLMQKGRRVKLKDAEGDAPARYIWKAERKR